MKRFIGAALAVVLAVIVFPSASPDKRVAPKKEGPPPVNKRGVSYSFEQDKTPAEDMALLAPGGDVPGIHWFYNWYVMPEAKAMEAAGDHNVVFYPMVWNPWAFEPMLEEYLQRHPETEWIMGYNEPNLKDQANMTPKQAAKTWPSLIKFAKKHNLKVLSPAMNYGWGVGVIEDKRNPGKNKDDGYWSAWRWLNEFFGIDGLDDPSNDTSKFRKHKGFKGVSLSDVDAISIHCYMPHAGAMKWYINTFKQYNKPIWLTEFCSWEMTDSLKWQMEVMSEICTYMELDPWVEKYAWFIPKGSEPETDKPMNKLLTKTTLPEMKPPELTPLGVVYINMGVADKTKWIPTGQRIIAAHFADCNLSEWIDKAGWPGKEHGYPDVTGGSVHFRPGTDSTGALDVYDFSKKKWLEYQVDVPDAKNYTLSVRNTAPEATVIDIEVDGKAAVTLNLRQSNTWTTSTVPLTLEAGKHQVRLNVTEGNCTLNWLQLD